MKTLTIPSLAAVLVIAAIAQAQTTSVSAGQLTIPFGDYTGYGNPTYQSSTAAEGFYRGLAEMARATGENNFYSSMALLNAADARRREIDNQQKWLESYFALRRMNAERRAAERGPRGTMEDWIRYAQTGKPRRLSPSELDVFTGQLAWPILLRSNNSARDREELEKVFADRAAWGTISAEQLVQVTKTTDAMLAGLKQRVRDVPAGPYLAARRFLESVAYEAAQPTAQVAARAAAPALAGTP
jgi:hypothetical protein